jgi:hypothetical protein
MTINVINDLVEVARPSIEAPAVGNPMSTPILYLKSNVGNQVFQNTTIHPDTINNLMVSATIQNTFSPGYSISAMGDAAVETSGTYLNNLNFQLVDANFQPVKLLSPMYLTISLTPIVQDANNDLSKWDGALPRDAPTPAQKAIADAEAQVQVEEQQKVEKKVKEKDELQELAYSLIVQVLSPLVQEQLQQQQMQQVAQIVQQEIANAKQEKQEVKQGIVQALLQDPDTLEMIEQLPEKEVGPFLNALVKEIMTQGMKEEPEQPAEPTPDIAPDAPIAETVGVPEYQPAPDQPTEAPAEAPAEAPPEGEPVQDATPQPTLEDADISGIM